MDAQSRDVLLKEEAPLNIFGWKAACTFKLEQFERAKWKEGCLTNDLS